MEKHKRHKDLMRKPNFFGLFLIFQLKIKKEKIGFSLNLIEEKKGLHIKSYCTMLTVPDCSKSLSFPNSALSVPEKFCSL